MGDVIREYMDIRFRSSASDITLSESAMVIRQGPVITVSREAGCSGNRFVMELAAFLNKAGFESKKSEWHWVNKEIIYETATELKVHPLRVQKLFKGEPRRLMDEVMDSLSTRYYKNDRVVTKAIREIVKKIASRGHVVILGRGAVGLTQNIADSLHIKLFAPAHWRIKQIQQKLQLNSEEAANFVKNEDKKRDLLIKKFTGSECANDMFDVMYNCSSLNNEHIFKSISVILSKRNIK